jgi:hypothetical protein
MKTEHGGARLEVDHQAVEDVLHAQDAGLCDVQLNLCGVQGLVAQDQSLRSPQCLYRQRTRVGRLGRGE